MSTIRVDNFGPSAGGTTYSARGIAKAWAGVEVNGTTSGALNISSVTDIGTGIADANFTSAFSNTNYAVSAGVLIVVATAYAYSQGRSTASQIRLVFYVSSSLADPTRYYFSADGDLA